MENKKDLTPLQERVTIYTPVLKQCELLLSSFAEACSLHTTKGPDPEKHLALS